MKIIKSTESITVAHPIFLIYSEPGLGKTSLGFSTKAPLLRDYDNGAHRAKNRQDHIRIETWADVIESNNPEVLKPYSTVVEDTVGRALDKLTVQIWKEIPKYNQNGALTLQGWGVLKTRFRQHLATLTDNGKDVLLIAHGAEDKQGDTRIWRPDIQGGTYGIVVGSADFVGFLYMAGNDRILDFSPSDRWVGKNPAQWPPFKIPPVEKATTFMAELMDKGRLALGQISDEHAGLMRQVAEWRERLATLESLDALNAQVPVVGGLVQVLKAQVAKLLIDRATALGFTFDKSAKAFVAGPSAGTQAA